MKITKIPPKPQEDEFGIHLTRRELVVLRALAGAVSMETVNDSLSLMGEPQVLSNELPLPDGDEVYAVYLALKDVVGK